MVDIEEIVEQQAEAAYKRQSEIKRFIYIIIAYMVVVTAIFSFAFFNLSETNSEVAQTNRELAEVINRRSPVLEYLRCHDNLEDTKSGYETEMVFAYIAYRENTSAATFVKYDEARSNYEKANKNLLNPNSCPDFPN